MSAESVEIVRRIYDAAARRDAETVLDLYDPEVEWDTSHGAYWGTMVGHGTFRGHDGLRRFFRELNDAWEEITFIPEELIDGGDRVISVNNARGKGLQSGIEVGGAINFGVWTARDGRVVRVVWYSTRQEALDAAGIGE